MLAQYFYFFICIGCKLIECNHYSLAKALQVLYVLVEVPVTGFHTSDVWLLDIFQSYTTMHLQRLEGNHENGEVWLQTCLAAFDVIELLSTEICTESCLCNGIVAILKSCSSSHDGIAAMSNVGKRTAMNKCWCSLCCLNQIWLQSIEKESYDTATYTHILYGKWLVILGDAQEDVIYTATKIIDACCKTHDSHDFRSRSDIEASLCLDAVLISYTGDDAAETTVVYVHHAAPENLLQLESLCLVLETVVIQEGSNHVVGLCNGMEIASEMEINLIHRQNLGVTATCSTTLHAEARTQRWFAKSHYSLLANLLHTQGETHGYGGLAITSLGRTDSGNEDEMMVLKLVSVNFVRSNLSDVTAVVFHLVFVNSKFCCHFIDRAHFY